MGNYLNIAQIYRTNRTRADANDARLVQKYLSIEYSLQKDAIGAFIYRYPFSLTLPFYTKKDWIRFAPQWSAQNGTSFTWFSKAFFLFLM